MPVSLIESEHQGLVGNITSMTVSHVDYEFNVLCTNAYMIEEKRVEITSLCHHVSMTCKHVYLEHVSVQALISLHGHLTW